MVYRVLLPLAEITYHITDMFYQIQRWHTESNKSHCLVWHLVSFNVAMMNNNLLINLKQSFGRLTCDEEKHRWVRNYLQLVGSCKRPSDCRNFQDLSTSSQEKKTYIWWPKVNISKTLGGKHMRDTDYIFLLFKYCKRFFTISNYIT